MDIVQVALLILLGLAAGASGGLLGIGGSVVMIPGMVFLFGPRGQHLYQAAAMIVNVFVLAPAAWRHRQAKAVLRQVTRWTIPAAIIGAVCGVWVSELPVFHGNGRGYLQIGFSLFLLYVLAHNLWRLGARQRLPVMDEAAAARLSRTRLVAWVGLPTGLVGGLLGIGGGLLAVPAQQVGLKIPLQTAIANSAATIVWSSLIGAVVKNYHMADHGFGLGDSLLLAACLAPSAMIGSWFASARVHRWPVRVIRVAFVALLLYCGGRLLLAGWRQVRGAPDDGTDRPAFSSGTTDCPRRRK